MVRVSEKGLIVFRYGFRAWGSFKGTYKGLGFRASGLGVGLSVTALKPKPGFGLQGLRNTRSLDRSVAVWGFRGLGCSAMTR